jgi:SAM-dependent methyltransferase
MYDPYYFAPLAAVENRHFWFRARNRAIAAVAGRLSAALPDGYRVLEAGCGTGNVLRVLEQVCRRGLVVGMDLFAEGLAFARGRVRCPLVRADLAAPPFADRFHLIGLFDVLEHLEDDRAALRDLYRLLAPGGRLILTVPAHPALWSYFDEESGHRRRYRAEELREKLAAAGYAVEYLTPYMAVLLPLLWLGRRLAGRLGGASSRERAARDLRVTPGANGVLYGLLGLEAGRLARLRELPFGASFLVVAAKGGGRP